MRLLTKLNRKIDKYNNLHLEVEELLSEYLSQKNIKLNEESIAKIVEYFGIYDSFEKKIIYEINYADVDCQLFYNSDGALLVTNIFDKESNLKCKVDNYEIKSFSNYVRQYKLEGNLFFKGIALIKNISYENVTWGIISEKGEVLVKPHYKELTFIYNLYQVTYFIAVNDYGKKGIIDQTGRVVLPFDYTELNLSTITVSYYTKFTAVKNKRYYILLWECNYDQINNVYVNLGESFKVIEIFNTFLPSKNSTFIGIKNGKFGWYDYAFRPILKCTYKNIKVYTDDSDFYDERIFAIMQNEEGKWGLFKFREKFQIPCIYDRIIAHNNKDFVVLVKGRKKFIYDFNRKFQMVIPDEIVPSSVDMSYFHKKAYFSARKSKNKSYALFSGGFDMITDYYFNNCPYVDDAKGTVSAMVPRYIFADGEHEGTYDYVFKWKEFINIFGVKGAGNKRVFIESIDKKFIQRIKKKGIIYSDVAVAGIQYYDFERIWEKIKMFNELIMVGEPNNPYDKNAIALYFNYEDSNYKLGYIPRSINREVRTLIADGSDIKIIVNRLKSNDSYEYLYFRVLGV